MNAAVVHRLGEPPAWVDPLDAAPLTCAGVTTTETRRLEEVNDAFRDVLGGELPARLVFDLR